MPEVIFDNIKKAYAETLALNNVSFTIPNQKIFGLLGPNGAGKTTLIRILTNIIEADSGYIHINDRKIRGFNPLKFGYMPEERGLYKKMKVGEQLLYLCQLKGLSKKEAKSKIDLWIDKFDIQDWWNKRIHDLSKGMQQKVQFIATVCHNPGLLILDEPFSGLDPINTELIKEEIFKLAAEGKTIIFSTHRMEQVEEICSHIALINKGEMILDGEVEALKNRFKKNIFKVVVDNEQLEIKVNIQCLKQENNTFWFQLNEGFTSNQLLQSILDQEVEIKSFEEEYPSINEIFIEQVNPNRHE